LIKTLYRKRHT